jgi:hypothetical protein
MQTIVDMIERMMRASEQHPLAAAFYAGVLFVLALAACVAGAWKLLRFRSDLDELREDIGGVAEGMKMLTARVDAVEEWRAEVRALRRELGRQTRLLVAVLRSDASELRHLLATPESEDERG